MIAINSTPLNSGIGKYSEDITKIIPVYSFIPDKTRINYDYAGRKIYGIYPPVTSGWALNNYLLPVYLKLKNIKSKYVHLLSPMNNIGLKGIVTIHDLYFMHRKKYYESYFYLLYRKFHKWLILTPSEFTKNELIKYFKYDEEQIRVVPLSINEWKFYNIHPEKKIYDVITVGDGISKHNYDISLLCHNNNLSHIHVGKDSLHSMSRRVVNIANEDLNYLYNFSNVAIRYSDIEGFGIPAIESTFAGTPIILKRLPVFEEIMGKDYPLFVNSIEEIPEKIKEAKEFKINSYFNAEWFKKYSLTTFINNMRSIYNEYGDN